MRKGSVFLELGDVLSAGNAGDLVGKISSFGRKIETVPLQRRIRTSLKARKKRLPRAVSFEEGLRRDSEKPKGGLLCKREEKRISIKEREKKTNGSLEEGLH